MGLVIAVIALLASLAALWVAADASKRAEGQQKKFVDAYLINIKQAISDIRVELNQVATRIDQMDDRLKNASAGSSNDIEQMKLEMTALKSNLGTLAERLTASARPPQGD